jgi:hypothetical protein
MLQRAIDLSKFRGECSFVQAKESDNTYARIIQMLLDVVIRSNAETTQKGRGLQTFSQKIGTQLFFVHWLPKIPWPLES